MCGRFTYLYTWKQLHRLLDPTAYPEVELSPRYNTAPTQLAPVVRLDENARRIGAMMRWGLIPSWAKDASIGNSLINARCETVATKPAFRSAFLRRRCIVPISGFYEWRKALPGPARTKQPFYITLTDDQPMMLAGLWEIWRPPEVDDPVHSFTILTCEPNQMMSELHDRMPVILDEAGVDAWLSAATQPDALAGLMTPFAAELMWRRPVSARVNSPRHEGPELIRSVDEAEPGLF